MDQPWIYIVLFGLVFIVYAKIMPKSNETKGQQGPSIHEIEETMEHFAAELEEQNQLLLKQLAETKKEYEIQTLKLGARVDMLENQLLPINQELAKLEFSFESLQKGSSGRVEGMIASPSESQADSDPDGSAALVEEPAVVSMNIKARYGELFALYDQGKSIDSIAKKLNMTKGEVNLIVQLAKQEEQQHAQ